ncbi:hypothetical protein D3C81_1796500 [compost metagenome]
MVKQQQRGGTQGKNLSAKLSTDRTTGTGHHDHLAFDATFQQIRLRRHRIASEQIGDIHFLDVLDLHPTAGQVSEVRNAANMQRKTL